MEPKSEFKVVAWKDYHGVETVFMVVDRTGYRYGVYPSEREAIDAAAKATEVGVAGVAWPRFALEAR
jgi:hypothetical protein